MKIAIQHLQTLAKHPPWAGFLSVYMVGGFGGGKRKEKKCRVLAAPQVSGACGAP